MMKDILVLVIFVVALNVGVSTAQLCNVTTNNTGIPLPSLPDQFQATIEYNYRSKDNNYTQEYEEYYDYINNRATIVRFANFKKTSEYYLYKTQELISVTDLTCLVSKLTNDENPFGMITDNSTSRIDPPSYLLKLGLNLSTDFMGSDVVRGINVLKWQSCMYQSEINTTIRLTWAFSDQSIWNSTITFGNVSIQFPVEVALELMSDAGHSFEIRYHYTSYRPYIEASPEIFETPKSVYCPGRKPTKPLPKVPNHFSYKIEVNLVSYNETTSQAEWYDLENNLARIDYIPLAKQDISLLGNDKISEIHDFNSGVRYVLNTKQEKCLNVTTLDPYSVDTNFANTSSQYVRIRTALEMFHFDKVDYQYHGSRKIRDIDCDVWIARRNDWPPQPGYNTTSTWEWYFMSQNWTAFNSADQEVNIPIQLVLTKFYETPLGYLTDTVIYNYFDFKKEKPDLFAFDIEYCFEGQASKHLRLTFKGVKRDDIENKHEFKYQVLNKIANLTYVLPTRIDQVELDFNNDNTDVLFKLLDKAPIKGNVENPVSQISVEDAFSLLKKYVDNGEFRFTIKNKEFAASSNSLSEVITGPPKAEDPFKNKMVIVSIIVSGVIGLVIGFVIIFLIGKLRSKKSEQPALSMSGLMNNGFEK